jgi:CubicO group peptidase (beta-lactamase class C family)
MVVLYVLGAVVLVAVLVLAALIGYGAYQVYKYEHLTDTHDLKSRIDKLAGDYVREREHVGLVVGVCQRGWRYVQGYGKGVVPDGKTIYESGSITKVFTAVTLARLEADGVLTLDDPISRHLPKDMALAVPVRGVTLRQLATHTSGLPTLPDDFDAKVKDEANPYVDYRTEDLYAYLGRAQLDFEPGKKSEYSNLGMGLLGHILSLKTGKSYEATIRETVCTPLGMPDTVMTLSPAQQERRLPVYSPKGKPVLHWEFDVLAPAGGFYSTADDLLAFVEANLNPGDRPLAKALLRAQEKHFKHWTGDAGLGWVIEERVGGLVFHWHNGGTGGSVSFLGFDKANQTGVVLLSNYGDAWANDDAVDQMGFEILTLASKVSLE